MEAHGSFVNWGEGDAAMIKGERSKVKREVEEWSKAEVTTKSVLKEPKFSKKISWHSPDWGLAMHSKHDIEWQNSWSGAQNPPVA